MASPNQELLNEIKKTYDELKFKKEKLLSEITLLSESIKNPTCSSSTEEQKKLFEKLCEEMEQLKTEYEKLSCYVNFTKTAFNEK
ncbi:hypothetical protein K7X08_002985 [Anisodus acutangulus]|uniref:Uncharacterized protein n=1 Tax=Anisodus acutangulus TaxID=402998 RepID=A0A9Q1MCS8_9SOLA|nr:hypothetical protein K7X08_002985 [Anisodus acutangulus]